MTEIRELTEGDLSAIAATRGGPAWNASPDLWSSYLRSQKAGEKIILLAIDGNAVIAYGTLIWQSDYPAFRTAGIPEINNLVVAAFARRQGLASKLIKALEQRALEKGVLEIGIGVGLYADYGAAQRLYPKLGYIPDGAGICYGVEPVKPGAEIVVDDDLVLWFTKTLNRSLD